MHDSLQEVLGQLTALVGEEPAPGRALRRAMATGRMRGQQPPWRRVELRPMQAGRQGLRLQITTLDASQAHAQNLPFGAEAAAAVTALFQQGYGHWHLESDATTWQARMTKRGHAQTHKQATPAAVGRDAGPTRATAKPPGPTTVRQVLPRTVARQQETRPSSIPTSTLTSASASGSASSQTLCPTVIPPAHNRVKARLLDPADPLWAALQMTGIHGDIKPSAQRKYRQVDAFLRHLAAALDAHPLPPRPLTVIDLGCGNAALTFAAHRYLTHIRGLEVRLLGVDVKAQAAKRNSALAASLACRDVSFVQGTIVAADLPPADIVLALHACDTATDEALARAIAWQAHLVLASPCCHHDLQRQLAGQSPPAPYGLVAHHGILRERLADVLTEACRAALLGDQGYACEVVEFTSADQTPRNTLLRAVRTGRSPRANAPHGSIAYAQLTAAWGIKPRLEQLLSRSTPPSQSDKTSAR